METVETGRKNIRVRGMSETTETLRECILAATPWGTRVKMREYVNCEYIGSAREEGEVKYQMWNSPCCCSTVPSRAKFIETMKRLKKKGKKMKKEKERGERRKDKSAKGIIKRGKSSTLAGRSEIILSRESLRGANKNISRERPDENGRGGASWRERASNFRISFRVTRMAKRAVCRTQGVLRRWPSERRVANPVVCRTGWGSLAARNCNYVTERN